MQTYADASQNKKQLMAAAFSGKPGKLAFAYVLEDNRSQAVVQKKMADATKQLASKALSQPAAGGTAYYFKDNRAQAVVQRQQVNAIAEKQETIQKKVNTTGLPDQLKSGIENLSGHSMDDVKVHYNSSQPAQLNAHAYAQGTDIHIAAGQEKHLPHEAWHVVQQKQGRVKPTMQLKGKVNINDDDSLEKEADVMGAKALSGSTVMQNKSFRNAQAHKPVVQGVFKMLSEANIINIINSAALRGDTLDAQYLQGLYVTGEEKEFLDEQEPPQEYDFGLEGYDEEEDEDYEDGEEDYYSDGEGFDEEFDEEEQQQPQDGIVHPDDEGFDEEDQQQEQQQDGVVDMEDAVQGNEEEDEIQDNEVEDLAMEEQVAQNYLPDFYIKVGTINLSYFTGEPALGKRTKLFARADALADAEAQQEQEINQGNVQQILANHTEYWDQKENGPLTAAQIKQNIIAFYNRLNKPVTGEAEGEKTLNNIVASMLTGGEAEDDEGSYGAIEFRFTSVAGVLYLLNTLPEIPELFKKFPGLNVHAVSQANINEGALAYREANLPYKDTRIRPNFIFIEQSLVPAFNQALQQQQAQQAIVRRNPSPALADPINDVGLFAGPLNAKDRTKEYTFRATRGGRDAGQKAVMGNMSAHDYVARFSPEEADAYNWEWLHLQGSRLSGPNRPENLVAGTAAANTHMIPYERAIFRLSGLATNNNPVNVNWSATVRQSNGQDTHIGDQITIVVTFPHGAPQGADPKDVALFVNPVVFSASEGASFTKLDRDLLDA